MSLVLASQQNSDVLAAKVVILGESATGKSSLAQRFVHNKFLPNPQTTVGAAFLSRTLALPPLSPTSAGGGLVKYDIWDTAGQERYRSLAPIYYRGACGALVMYDITSVESFKKAQTWMRELRANAGSTIIIFLLGNKKDMGSLRQVSYEDGAKLAQEEGVDAFFETSAKENENVEAVFAELGQRMLKHGLALSRAGGAEGALVTNQLNVPLHMDNRASRCIC